MTSPTELLKRMQLLVPSQFEELLLRLHPDIDASHLPLPPATQTQRAISLIHRLEQEESGLGRLQRLLEDLDWFKEFLPDGTYLVGQGLLERKTARERQAMKEAAARGEDPEDYRVTPEKFYTFRREAAWLGIFRRWDAPRSFHSELMQRVVSASYGRDNCPAAAIVGPGGCGKSVSLRRLALDLADQGDKVWWVKEPERLLRFGLSQLADTGDGPHFLLIDGIEGLQDEYVRRFQRDLQRNRSLILVVAGRRLPVAFRLRVSPGAGLFVPAGAADRVSILEKIAETIPAWAETARQLAVEPLKQARLIRMLVVLARQKAIPRNLQELEMAFLEILADDITTIRSMLPGLAEAVIDAAGIREVGRDVSRETLIALADYHQPGAFILTLLEQINGNPRWQALAPLLSYDPEYDVVRFHHDELAEGLILAGQQGLLGLRSTGDNLWRKATLNVVINRGSFFSSSYALSAFVRNRSDLVGSGAALAYIRQLLAAENGHHAYLRLIVDEALAVEHRERLNLLLAAARTAPLNRWFWGTVWGWIRRHYKRRKERAEVLEQLYQAGCRAFSIMNPLLQCLPPRKARALAKEWLEDPATHPHVLCSCLDLLGEEAKDEAKRLLAEPATPPDVLCSCLNLLGKEAKKEAKRLLAESKDKGVLCSCLNLLGEEAKDQAKRLLAEPATPPDVLCSCLNLLGKEATPFAVQRIRSWTETDPALLVRCFQVAGATPEAQKAVEEMLAAWDESVPPALCVAALRAPFDTPLRIQRAREILRDWPRQYRPLVAAALTAFWSHPRGAIEYCEAIVGRWHQEILYRHKHGLSEYDGHIIKALSHPSLRQEARKAVQEMLSVEASSPGFLSPELRRQAENITQGEWPPWSESDAGTS